MDFSTWSLWGLARVIPLSDECSHSKPVVVTWVKLISYFLICIVFLCIFFVYLDETSSAPKQWTRVPSVILGSSGLHWDFLNMLSRLSESPCHGLSDLVNPILCHCLVLTAKVLELVWHALRYLDERHRTVGVGQTWDVVRYSKARYFLKQFFLGEQKMLWPIVRCSSELED